MKAIYWIALILTVVGGINWGLVAVLQLDLVAALFGAGSALANIVYIAVAVSAVALLVMNISHCSKKHA